MIDHPSAPSTDVLVARAKAAVTALRDAARDGTTMQFRVRDRHVTILHDIIGKYEGLAASSTPPSDLPPMQTLAQVRQICADMVVSSRIHKRVHEFALVVWKHIEMSHQTLDPEDWNALLDKPALSPTEETR